MERRKITISLDEEKDLLREAFDNGYRILFEGLGVKDLIRECSEEDRDLYITFFVEDGPSEEDMYDMLLWYEEEEFYERCGVIKRYMDEKFGKK